MCQNFTSLSSILSEKKAVKKRSGRAGPVHCFTWFSWSSNAYKNLFDFFSIFVKDLRTVWFSSSDLYTGKVWQNLTIPSQGASKVMTVSDRSWGDLFDAITIIYKFAVLWKYFKKKICQKISSIHLKIYFIEVKKLSMWNRVESDRSERIFLMKLSEF